MSEYRAVRHETILIFGPAEDRVIETVGIAHDQTKFEIGYYNGTDKAKAIINISSATGCHVGCNFCELTERGRQLAIEEMFAEVQLMLTAAKNYDHYAPDKKPLKINIAKTGEPIMNPHIPEALHAINETYPGTSFKFSTVMPRVKFLGERIKQLAQFAAAHEQGSTQLTISLISTDEAFRAKSASGRLASFRDIRQALEQWYLHNPNGRKANGSLLLGRDTPCDPQAMRDVLPPDMIKLRIRPIIETGHSLQSNISTLPPEAIAPILARFKDCGYDINAAGMPTGTEMEHKLASNVTRHRLASGLYPQGTYYVIKTSQGAKFHLIPAG